jgi:hypothetical protein
MPARVSLADLARTEPVRFAGQKNDPEKSRPKKEPQIEDLKKALRDALADANSNPNPNSNQNPDPDPDPNLPAAPPE